MGTVQRIVDSLHVMCDEKISQADTRYEEHLQWMRNEFWQIRQLIDPALALPRPAIEQQSASAPSATEPAVNADNTSSSTTSDAAKQQRSKRKSPETSQNSSRSSPLTKRAPAPAFEDIAEAAGLPKDLNKLTKEVLLKELEKRGCVTMTIKALKKDLVDTLKTLMEDIHMRNYNDHNSENHLVANLASTSSSSNADSVVSVSSADANDSQQQQPRKASILAEFRSQVATGAIPAAPVVDAAVQFEARLRRTSQGAARAEGPEASAATAPVPAVEAQAEPEVAAPAAATAAVVSASAAEVPTVPVEAVTAPAAAPVAPAVSPVKPKSPFRGSMLSPLAIMKRMMDISPAPKSDNTASATANNAATEPTPAEVVESQQQQEEEEVEDENSNSVLVNAGSTTPFGKPAVDAPKRDSDAVSATSSQVEFHDAEEGIAEPMDEVRSAGDADSVDESSSDKQNAEHAAAAEEPEGESPLASEAVEDEAGGVSLEDIISKNPESAAAEQPAAAQDETSSKVEEATAAASSAAAAVASTPSSKSTLSLNIFTSKKAATAEPVKPNVGTAAPSANPPNLLASGATSFLTADSATTKTTGLIKPTVRE